MNIVLCSAVSRPTPFAPQREPAAALGGMRCVREELGER
jgi:hypothetical protein